MAIEIRAVAPDELEAMYLADQRGFGGTPIQPDHPRSWAEAELDRTRIAIEGDQIVGVSRAYSFELTVAGGATVPAAAVSWVAVLPTHRRRGVLTKMIGALHDDARERGEPVAILTASESLIYGRYGYGTATWRVGISAERAHVQFRDTDERGGRMRMLTQEEGEKVLPQLYERMRSLRAGSVSRPDYWWPTVFWGSLDMAKKSSFVAVHSDAAGNDDGFVAYELKGNWQGGIPQSELVALHVEGIDAGVRAALWRYLFGVDLVGTVKAVNVPADEPLRHLVTDPRRIRIDYINDGLWVAPLDPAPYLAARTYSIDGSLVIEVHAPDGTSARYALEGGPDGAQCTTTTATPDLVCTTAVLGACSLGGNRWSEFAQAGRVEGNDDALRRADLMFFTSPAPALFTNF